MKHTTLAFSLVSLLMIGCAMESANEAGDMTEAESRFFLDANDIVFQYTEGDDHIVVDVEVEDGADYFAAEELQVKARWLLPDGTSETSPQRLAAKRAGPAFRYAMPMIGEGFYEFVVEQVEIDSGAAIVAPGVAKTLTIIGAGDAVHSKSLASKSCPSQNIIGTSGSDTLIGSAIKSDVISGKQSRDYLFGNGCDDYLYGNIDNDLLYGEDGDDYLDGGKDSDDCHGGPGVDTFVNCETIVQ